MRKKLPLFMLSLSLTLLGCGGVKKAAESTGSKGGPGTATAGSPSQEGTTPPAQASGNQLVKQGVLNVQVSINPGTSQMSVDSHFLVIEPQGEDIHELEVSKLVDGDVSSASIVVRVEGVTNKNSLDVTLKAGKSEFVGRVQNQKIQDPYEPLMVRVAQATGLKEEYRLPPETTVALPIQRFLIKQTAVVGENDLPKGPSDLAVSLSIDLDRPGKISKIFVPRDGGGRASVKPVPASMGCGLGFEIGDKTLVAGKLADSSLDLSAYASSLSKLGAGQIRSPLLTCWGGARTNSIKGLTTVVNASVQTVVQGHISLVKKAAH